MARHIVCALDRTVGHVSFCWDYVSIFIYKNSNYNKINQITEEKRRFGYLGYGALTSRNMCFPHRCKSEIISINTIATKLMSCPNLSITSQ